MRDRELHPRAARRPPARRVVRGKLDVGDHIWIHVDGPCRPRWAISMQLDVDRFRIEPPAPLSWICTQQEGPQRAAHETQDIFFAL